MPKVLSLKSTVVPLIHRGYMPRPTQEIPETTNSTKPHIYYVFFFYKYIHFPLKEELLFGISE